MASTATAPGDGHAEAAEAPFSVNAIVSLTNVLFFVVVQSVFFWFIASREVDRVVQRKAQILRQLRDEMEAQELEDGVLALDAAMVNLRAKTEQAASKQEQERSRANLRLMLWWMGPARAPRLPPPLAAGRGRPPPWRGVSSVS